VKACKIQEISADILARSPAWFDSGATDKDVVFGLILAACNAAASFIVLSPDPPKALSAIEHFYSQALRDSIQVITEYEERTVQ